MTKKNKEMKELRFKKIILCIEIEDKKAKRDDSVIQQQSHGTESYNSVK